MSPALLAALYCVPIVVACLIGGWLPRALKMTHTRMQMGVSFVAGLLLGVGLLHLMPHAFFEIKSFDKVVQWAMVGFLAMFFVARFLHFHHHDAPDESPAQMEAEEHTHDHDHDAAHPDHAGDIHSHAACDQHSHHVAEFGLHVHATTWIGTAFGMTLHSLIDGLALAAAVQAEWHGGTGMILAGFGVFLAVLLHKPFDSLTISMLMDSARCSRGKRRLINGLYAAVVPIGVAVFFLTLGGFGGAFLGAILAIAAGAFLCVATSDLLPELQFHTHDRTKLSIALLMGVGLAWGVIYFESSGHDHGGLSRPAPTPTETGPAHMEPHDAHDDHEH